MLQDQVIPDNPAANQMLLNDSFEDRWIALRVPGTFGINDRNGSAFTDPKAVGFAAINPSLLGKTEPLQALLEVFPRHEGTVFRTALRLGLITAQENVPTRGGYAESLGNAPLFG